MVEKWRGLDTEVGVSVGSSIWQATSCGGAVAVATGTGASCHVAFSVVRISTGAGFASSRRLAGVLRTHWTWIWVAAAGLALGFRWVRVWWWSVSPTDSWCIIDSVDTWIREGVWRDGRSGGCIGQCIWTTGVKFTFVNHFYLFFPSFSSSFFKISLFS